MLTSERYLLLLKHCHATAASPDELEVTIGDLGKLFHCTERNVKLIVRKMEEEDLIHWIPGRGRGNRSRITLRMSRDDFILHQAKQLAYKGEYREAFEFIHTHSEHATVKETFVEWLNGHFGYDQQASAVEGKDLLRLPVYRPLLSLDPAQLYFDFDTHMVRQIFDCLVQYDHEQRKIVPMLAHSWDSNPDGTRWTFYLRKGVRFHHGRELNVDDVLFTFQRLANRKDHSWMLSSVAKMEAIDKRTVTILLNYPNLLLPHILSSAAASILPADLVTQNEKYYWKMPIGTGPFHLRQWSHEKLELTVHEDYFMGRAYLDEVILYLLPSNIPNAHQVKWRQLIINDSSHPEHVDIANWEYIDTPQQSCCLLTWNRNKKGPQQKLAFRQAFNLIIDRQGLTSSLEQAAVPARGLIPVQDEDIPLYRYDSDRARELLIEADYDGSPLKLICHYGDLESAEWLRVQCAQIGIPLQIEYIDRDDMMNMASADQADCILYNLITADDEVSILETYLQPNSYIHYYMDTLLRSWVSQVMITVLGTSDQRTRLGLLQEIENRLIDEAQAHFLFHRTLQTYVHPSIRGLGVNRLGFIDFKDIWFTPTTSISS